MRSEALEFVTEIVIKIKWPIHKNYVNTKITKHKSQMLQKILRTYTTWVFSTRYHNIRASMNTVCVRECLPFFATIGLRNDWFALYRGYFLCVTVRILSTECHNRFA